MQAFGLALFQQGVTNPPSILLKHLDPSTRQEAQHDIAVYETKPKLDREQKKQKTAHARTANLPTELNPEQSHRMAYPKTEAAIKTKAHIQQHHSPLTLKSCDPRLMPSLTQPMNGRLTPIPLHHCTTAPLRYWIYTNSKLL